MLADTALITFIRHGDECFVHFVKLLTALITRHITTGNQFIETLQRMLLATERGYGMAFKLVGDLHLSVYCRF